MNQPCKQLNGLLAAFNNERVRSDQIVAVTNLQHHYNSTTTLLQ